MYKEIELSKLEDLRLYTKASALVWLVKNPRENILKCFDMVMKIYKSVCRPVCVIIARRTGMSVSDIYRIALHSGKYEVKNEPRHTITFYRDVNNKNEETEDIVKYLSKRYKVDGNGDAYDSTLTLKTVTTKNQGKLSPVVCCDNITYTKFNRYQLKKILKKWEKF